MSLFAGPDTPTTGLTGSPLDRADHLRRDPAQAIALRSRPDARWLILDDLKPLLTKDEHAELFWAHRSDLPHNATSVFLGLTPDGAPRFAAATPAAELIAEHSARLMDARAAATLLGDGRAAILAHARSLLAWHARHGHCSVCGAPTTIAKAGHARTCPACHAEHFPRTDPVVIMLALHRDHALVGRQPGFPPRFFSALAGFVEPGENIEEAVARELHEEAGIITTKVRYLASQPWPFPSSLMIACFAQSQGVELTIDFDELEEARWVTKAEVAAALDGSGEWLAPPPMAIAHTLLKAWIES